MVDLVVSSKLKDYRKRYMIPSNVSDGLAFGRFANHTIVATHQPDAIDSDTELLDLICVDGKDDMGIDGLAIKFNGSFIKSCSQIDDLIDLNKSNPASAELIFIQSKYRDEFNSGDYGKFCDGIADFLSSVHHEPHNEKIDDLLKIKDYIFSDKIFDQLSWLENPTVRVYFVSMGDWNGSEYIEAKFKRLKDDIKKEKIYGNVISHVIDCDAFKKIRNDLDNVFSISITTNGELQLTDVDGIKKSSIFLCMAQDFLPLLENSEGLIRKSIFFDNVRDFQGMTSINNEVLDTIESKPKSFILLNNGITIICDSFEQQNRRIKIKNPQIVNGCQTSNLIFLAYKQGKGITNVSLSIKLIETSDPEIINDIVKGTNKQNIVYDAAFETTKTYHKNLEKFFEAITNEESLDSNKIYYERRSKQFASNNLIKQYQRINIRLLTQSYISTFLKKPHRGHRHESKLLKEFENKIFMDGQSYFQYYIASLLEAKLELFFIENQMLKKQLYTYKNQLLFILLEILPGSRPNINNKNQMDNYCKNIHHVLIKEDECQKYIEKVIQVFSNMRNEWVTEKGTRYTYGIKDSEEFTNFVLKKLNSEPTENIIENVGEIMDIKFDIYNRLYCFIKREPDNLFAHSLNNIDIDFSKLQSGQLVTYKIEETSNGAPKVVSMKLVENS